MIDLHVHSTASDGTNSPAELAEIAARAGLSAFALTDHDTLEGLSEAGDAANAHGVRLVPACEISCEVEHGTMHLLVYFLEDRPGPLQDRLSTLQSGRAGRNDRIVEALQSNGVELSIEEVLEEAGGGSVGRPHLAAVLLRKGYVSSIQEAFDTWLAKGRPAYFERERLSPEESISLARASGAVSVLAHPGTLSMETAELDSFVAELASMGLDGIEAEYARYERHQRDTYHQLAEKHGLCSTGGSDYHGDYKPGLAMGTGLGDLKVPDDYLTALETRLASRRLPAEQA